MLLIVFIFNQSSVKNDQITYTKKETQEGFN